jgi:hypothetical protein
MLVCSIGAWLTLRVRDSFEASLAPTLFLTTKRMCVVYGGLVTGVQGRAVCADPLPELPLQRLPSRVRLAFNVAAVCRV